MGQKVNPIGMRVGINKDWNATWFANKQDFAKLLLEDQKIKKFIKKKYFSCAISRITIERTAKSLVVNIFTGRPGMLIGTKGAGAETLKKDIAKIAKPTGNLIVNIKEVKKPDLDSTLVAESIAVQLEKRISFKRAMKQALQRVMRAGAKGCKVQVSGVVDGANTMARTEHYMEGSLPLHTLRADVDYGVASAFTNYGKLGVKVWIYKGEIIPSKNEEKGDK
ncbi:MAG: 30S ribosomal protein S3 [Clostridia bacterium]|nr:30S ribosomal protein S3 [Clostridia bacterium]MDD3231863.1 30S ribosomal protein S3 [Clostridia bacterium]MDD3862387.1 30S ribosomal protein S3 [Clostridia bacterium]MDD4408466.1 30S ribosomal protein S3 [Clostridia bacterium]